MAHHPHPQRLPELAGRLRGAGVTPARSVELGGVAHVGLPVAPVHAPADPDHELAEAYGVWVEQTYKGKRYMGIKRSTFVIDAGGNVARAMYGVNPDRNPAEVLDALPEPSGAPAS